MSHLLSGAPHHLRRVVVTGTSVLLVAGLAPFAGADELDDLIKDMGEVSREAAAKNEEVKQLEDDVNRSSEEVDAIQKGAEEAAQQAQEALAQEKTAREQLDHLAGSRYRLSNLNREITTLGATDPQSAIDRAAYLGTLSRNKDEAIRQLTAATQDAAEKQDAAFRQTATARFEHSKLEESLEKLRQEKENLDKQVQGIKERVDALNEEERQRWENKNNPVAIDVERVTNTLRENMASAISAGSSEASMNAVEAALSKVGAPYSWGATGPDAFDCSGLIYWAYGKQGMSIPRTSQAQLSGGTPVSMDQLQPGDVVGYYGGSHVGMYIGDGQIVHAADYGIPVQVVSVNSMPVSGAARF